MVYECYSIDIISHVFNYMECITGGNIVLHIDDQDILYYHIDVYRPIMMEHRLFQKA